MPLLNIDIWLHNFCENYFDRSVSYRVAIVEMFKTTPQNVEKPLTPREKKSKIDYRYWGWMVFGKMCKGTTTVEENKTK